MEPTPSSTPPRQIKKLVFSLEDDDDNPFVDKEAEEAEEEHESDDAYATTTLRNVIGECATELIYHTRTCITDPHSYSLQECAVSGPTVLEDYQDDLDTLLSEWYIAQPKLE